MEFLITLVAGVFALVGGIAGNILASDLCVSASSTCSRIIKAAARRTGDDGQQRRYEEEWLADLAERETVNAKYRHAVGCYFISHQIRRESRKLWLHILYVVPHYGKFQVRFNLSSWLFSIWFAAITSRVGFIQNGALGTGISYYCVRFARAAYRGDSKQMLQLAKFALDSAHDRSVKDWPFAVRLSRAGKKWDLTEIAKMVVEESKLVAFLKSKTGGNNPREIAEALIKPRKELGEAGSNAPN